MKFRRPTTVPPRSNFAVLALAVVITVACSRNDAAAPSTPSGAPNTSTYAPPNLDGFTLIREEDRDGDGDGVNETHVKRYRNARGDSLFSMTSNDILWAWSLDAHADDDAVDRNYVIRDSNCDGIFDERYTLDDEFHVPECVKR